MTLELLVGPIASGKSTYCREAAKNGSIIVNDDSIVTSAHGGDYRLYNKSLKPFYKSIENHMVSTALAIAELRINSYNIFRNHLFFVQNN